MELSQNRLQHMYKVGCKMQSLAQSGIPGIELKGLEYIAPEKAFILGMLHDIGYAIVDNKADHAHAGGLLLRDCGFEYWKEVYYHGTVSADYKSDLLYLLNYADMTVGADGSDVTIEERLTEVASRYGEASEEKCSMEEFVRAIKAAMKDGTYEAIMGSPEP